MRSGDVGALAHEVPYWGWVDAQTCLTLGGEALLHESKLSHHDPNCRHFTGRSRTSRDSPWRSSHSVRCTRLPLRPFAHQVSWLEDHHR